MRTVLIQFWGDADHPKELARVTYNGAGPATVSGELSEKLEEGVTDLSQDPPAFRQPSDGDAFLDAVLWEYRGSYIHASELNA